MALEFVTHTIPQELNKEPHMDDDKRNQISKKLGETIRRLQFKMRKIDQREKVSWQLNQKRD